MGVKTHQKPNLLIDWIIRADEDRFSQFWFYDAPHSNEVVFRYRVKETGLIWSCYIDEGNGLEMTVGDETLRGRNAIREAARCGWHDKEIKAFYVKGWIYMDGNLILNDGNHNRYRFDNAWDAQETVLRESKNE